MKCPAMVHRIDLDVKNLTTLISENQALEISRPYSELRKVSGPAKVDIFFQFVSWIFFMFIA